MGIDLRTRFPSRTYEGERDLSEMRDFLVEARSRTDDWHYAHVGEMQFAFFMVLCHLDPHEHVRLWHDEHGKLIGYAILGEDPSFDWQVAPQAEWAGIESEALTWAHSLLIDLRGRDPSAWGGRMVSGSRQDNAQRLSFLEQNGFQYSGEFAEVNMLRPLTDPIPESVLPGGFMVRGLDEGDEILSRAAAQREVWQPWTVGNVTDEDYLRFMTLPGYDRELDVVAVTPDGAIAAYANGWLDPVNRIGDFGPVGALPAYRRLGLTRAVLLEGLRRMRSRDMDRVCISTTEGNNAAQALYRSIGFTEANRYLDFVRAQHDAANGAA
jgi:ribosomal protein S18 acetylase RimI-like enzyme